MVVFQALAAIAVGLPYPGGQSGAAFLAGPSALSIQTLGFVNFEGTNYWLVNDKGFVVRSFPRDVKAEEISDWLQGSSLPIGATAPDPRKTVSELPTISTLKTWMDVVALGMRFLIEANKPSEPLGNGLLVLFLSSYGPADHLYTARINAIYEEAQTGGINTLALFSGKSETKATIARFASLHNLKIPCALDPGNAYADAFRATRTPEAFLLSKELRVIYTGAVDDSTFGGDSARPYLLSAVKALANGGKANPAVTRVFGTPIDR